MSYLNLKIAGPAGVARLAHGRTNVVSAVARGRAHAGPRRAPGHWCMNVWNWLVSAGEARVRARIERGIYHF